MTGQRYPRSQSSSSLGDVVSNPAGWYPQPDGQQRYWDGELWTEHFAPGVSAETTARPLLKTEQPAASSGRTFSKAALFGWGGLAFVVLIGALSSGFSGAVIMLGLFGLVVGLIALARGRVSWARLGGRAVGGVVVGVALIMLTIGAVAAPPSTSPAVKSTTTSSDTPTTDAAASQAADAAAAAAQAADVAASQAADETAAAAASKAADEAAAAAKAADEATAAAAAKAADEAAASKAADEATAAAAAKAADEATAAAAAKAADEAAAAAVPPPPAASVYYENCTAARTAGVTPIYRGQPGYASKLDRDNDGIACE